jgi:hypothetical protein
MLSRFDSACIEPWIQTDQPTKYRASAEGTVQPVLIAPNLTKVKHIPKTTYCFLCFSGSSASFLCSQRPTA